MFGMLVSAVRLTCEKLTDQELATLNLAANLGGDAKSLPFYDKVRGLFTEGGGTRMHDETLDALAAVVNRRLGGASR